MMRSIFYMAAIMIIILFCGCSAGKQKAPTSFEECLAAGYPVMESFPRQCSAPDGTVFREQASHPQIPLEASLGEQFTLKVNQEASIKGTDMTIKFLNVTEDSRCPSGVECVWEGRVKVVLSVKTKEDSQEIELANSINIKESKKVDGYSASLVNVVPYSSKGQVIGIEEYVISLEVKEYVDPCTLVPDPGLCKAYFPRYYYDKASDTCKQFIWGGCEGVVPFETEDECESLCVAEEEGPERMEEQCGSGDIKMGISEAIAIAQASDCAKNGKILSTRSCNPNSNTWWIDMEANMSGCSPACVVFVTTKATEINWRCTGLVTPEDRIRQKIIGEHLSYITSSFTEANGTVTADMIIGIDLVQCPVQAKSSGRCYRVGLTDEDNKNPMWYMYYYEETLEKAYKEQLFVS